MDDSIKQPAPVASNSQFSGKRIWKFLYSLAILTAATALLNFIFSEVVAGAIYWAIPYFYGHQIFVQDLQAPITLMMTIAMLPISILLIWNRDEKGSAYRKFLHILLSIYCSLFTVWIFGMFMFFVSGNIFGFVISFVVFFLIYRSLFSNISSGNKPGSVSRVNTETPANTTNVENMPTADVNTSQKNSTMLWVYAIMLLLIFGFIGFLLYIFFVIFILCGGEGTGCDIPDAIPIIAGLIVLFAIILGWLKLVKKIKLKMMK